MRTPWLVIGLLSAIGCGDDDSPADAGARDGGATLDAALDDAALSDGGGRDSATASDAVVPVGATFPGAPTDPTALARAAVVFGSCIPDDGIRRFVDRHYRSPVASDPFFGDEAFDCLASTNTGCAAVESCVGVRFDRMGPCEDGCAGETLTACDDEWRFAIDCAEIGRTCDAEAGACVDATATACDGSSFTPECRAGAPVVCDDGHERSGFRCEDYGLTCASPAACAGSGAACASAVDSPLSLPAEGIRCTTPSTLEACVNGGTHEIACADIAGGFSCRTVGGASFCGLGDECDPSESTASCDGDTIVFCHAGALERVDCTSLGFTGCTEGGGRDGAFCSPSLWLGP
jgi:hypothetical protein